MKLTGLILADKSDGGDNVIDVGQGNNVDLMAEKLKSEQYNEVSDNNTMIGDIITYRLSEADINKLIIEEENKIKALGHSESTTKAFIESSVEIKKWKFYLSNERHFSVVILKDKSGNGPSMIIQKHGSIPFDFKVDSATDTKLTPEIKYEETPIEGKTESNYRRKR